MWTKEKGEEKIFFFSNVQLREHDSSLSFRSHQGNTLTLTNFVIYPLFPNCIQKLWHIACLSWDVGFKKPRPVLLIIWHTQWGSDPELDWCLEQCQRNPWTDQFCWPRRSPFPAVEDTTSAWCWRHCHPNQLQSVIKTTNSGFLKNRHVGYSNGQYSVDLNNEHLNNGNIWIARLGLSSMLGVSSIAPFAKAS